jgi:hypothetical protein
MLAPAEVGECGRRRSDGTGLISAMPSCRECRSRISRMVRAQDDDRPLDSRQTSLMIRNAAMHKIDMISVAAFAFGIEVTAKDPACDPNRPGDLSHPDSAPIP